MSRKQLAAVVLLAALVGGGAIVLGRAVSDGAERGPGAITAVASEADWSYMIPAGTGQRLDRGEQIEILPARIDAKVGETIRIENRDDRGYLLGPFYVGPGETLVQRFVTPGTFAGSCAVHPSGELVLDVEA